MSWTAKLDNERSHTRLGFKRDEALEGTSMSDPSLIWASSVTSEDWAKGVRDHVDALMSKDYGSLDEGN